jgi:hypothetical protein
MAMAAVARVSLAVNQAMSSCVRAGTAGCTHAYALRERSGGENRQQQQRKIYRDPECCVFAEDVGCRGHPLVFSLGPRQVRVGYCLVITVPRVVQGLSALAEDRVSLIGNANAAVVRQRERRIPSHLPEKTIRIGEVAGIAAPESFLGRLGNLCSG